MGIKRRKNDCIRFRVLKYQTCLPRDIKYDIAKPITHN